MSIALGETGLPDDAHLVDFAKNDQMSLEFLSPNPNNKSPAIIDPEGPGGCRLRDYYKVGERVGWADRPQVAAHMDRFLARPAVQKGLGIPARG